MEERKNCTHQKGCIDFKCMSRKLVYQNLPEAKEYVDNYCFGGGEDCGLCMMLDKKEKDGIGKISYSQAA